MTLLFESLLFFSHTSGEKLKIIETFVCRCQVIIEIVVSGRVTFISKWKWNLAVGNILAQHVNKEEENSSM